MNVSLVITAPSVKEFSMHDDLLLLATKVLAH